MLTPKEINVIKTKRYKVSPVSDFDVGDSMFFFNAEFKKIPQQFVFFLSFMNTFFIKLRSIIYFVSTR